MRQATQADDSAVQPRPAATVIVARDAADGVEVVLTQRHASLRFMGGAHVFPGGTVQPSDSSAMLASCIALEPLPWPHSDSAKDRAHALAAIRETFEEVGLLLGATSELGELAPLRSRALDGDDFGELVAAAGIALDLAQLVPLSRWVTPLGEARRYDTRFYVARAPLGQEAQSDARETTDVIWRTPARALADARRGAIRLSPPTARTLESFARVALVDELIATAHASSIPSIEPIIKDVQGTRMIVYPGDPEHPVRERVFDGPTRIVF